MNERYDFDGTGCVPRVRHDIGNRWWIEWTDDRGRVWRSWLDSSLVNIFARKLPRQGGSGPGEGPGGTET